MAPKGNDNAKKLKTKEIKDKVYKDYCDHISAGWPRKAWCYEKEGLTLSWNTIESYIEKDPDFDPTHKEIAISKALKLYAGWGKEMMLGKVEKAQPVLFQIFVRNMFEWDKPEAGKEEAKGAFNSWKQDQKK